MRFEAGELIFPEGAHFFEPAFEIFERLAFETIDAQPRVVLVRGLGDEPALSEDAKVPAHRRSRHREGVREIAGAARLFSQQIDDPSARGIGESEQGAVENFAIEQDRS